MRMVSTANERKIPLALLPLIAQRHNLITSLKNFRPREVTVSIDAPALLGGSVVRSSDDISRAPIAVSSPLEVAALMVRHLLLVEKRWY